METVRVVARSLEEIIKHNMMALIRRFHLNKDYIIGLVGDRGSGKSLSGANIAMRDFMVNGETCWSNMHIKLTVNVKDETARNYHLSQGGSVVYESKYLDKHSFLNLDSMYENSVLFFDEFNLEYGEARRSGTDVNLMADRAIQQLRKLQSGLIYTVLDEMYIDTRIRSNTDLFIRCSDVAFNPQNLQAGMRQGVHFEWWLYPMTPKILGNGMTFRDTKRPEGPIPITMGDIWGIIDTFERQAVGQTKYSQPVRNLLNLRPGEEVASLQEKQQWGWLDKRLKEFFEPYPDGELLEVNSDDFRQFLGVDKEDWPEVAKKVWKKLPDMTVKGNGSKRSPIRYIISVSKMLSSAIPDTPEGKKILKVVGVGDGGA